MDKLLLTLTLVAFSSGVLCNAEQNLTDTANTEDTGHLLHASASYLKELRKCVSPSELPSGYIPTPHMGAHKLHTRKMNWNDARITCKDESAQLAIINSNAEAAVLLNWLAKERVHEAWLGIHDMFGESNWITLDEVSLYKAGYHDWLPGEPSNSLGENCGTLKRLDGKGGLNDLECDENRDFFCKIYIC